METRRDGRTDVSLGVQVEGRTFHRQHSDGSPGRGDDDDHEAREPNSSGRKYRDKNEVNKAKIEKAPQQYDAKHFIQDPMQLSSGSKQTVWPSGGTITATIDSTETAVENKVAEVESISSETKRSNTRDMNSVATALTTGIDAAVPQVSHGTPAAATAAAAPNNIRG